jgi:hypothetical protein
MATKSSITFKIEKKQFVLEKRKIKQILKSTVRSWKAGAYIPLSKDFAGDEVYILIIEKEREQMKGAAHVRNRS